MIRSILAPNPSPLTGPGTNTFLIGQRGLAVIDPGPDLPAHLAAIRDAGPVTHIIVTHTHLDHSQGARTLADMTGAPILAFGTATQGRSPLMARMADAGLTGGGEGLDHAFVPDIILRDGDVIEGDGWNLTALHTPGHCGNHLAFRLGDSILCGDVVMGWATTMISPPDGDLLDYMRTLNRLLAQAPARLLPAHGDPIDAPAARLRWLADHRRERSAQILAALRDGPADADTLARRIYDVGPHLMRAAARNVLAHLIAFAEIGAVLALPEPAHDAQFALPDHV